MRNFRNFLPKIFSGFSSANWTFHAVDEVRLLYSFLQKHWTQPYRDDDDM